MVEPLTLEFEFRNKRYKDASRGLDAFAKSLGEGIHRAGPVLSKELKSFLNTTAEALARRHGRAYPSGKSPNSLNKRSGRGIRSIKQSVRVKGTKFSNIQGEIGGVGYLRIQETGGTIKPKKAKYLTIPLDAALNKNGTPKKKRAKDWDNTFVAKSKKGNLIIFQKRGSRIIPLYVLKKSVYIPPRLNMGKTLRIGIPYFVDTAMDKMVKEFVNG